MSAGADIGDGVSAYFFYDDLTNDVDIPETMGCVDEQTDGPDAFFKVVVDPNEIVDVNLEAADRFEDAIIYIFDDCADPAGTCRTGATSTDPQANARWVNDTGSQQTVIVAADNDTTSPDGPFGVTIDVRQPECTPGDVICEVVPGSPDDLLRECNSAGLYEDYACDGGCGNVTANRCDNPRGDICLDAQRLTGPSGTLASEFSGTNALELPGGQTNGCFLDGTDDSDGPDDFYTIDLTAGDLLNVSLDTEETTAFLMFFESCDPQSCLETNTNQGSTTQSYYAFTDTTLYIVVDNSTASTDTYELSWDTITGLTCEPNETRCLDANTLATCASDGSGEFQTVCANGCAGGGCVGDQMNQGICADVASGRADVGEGVTIYRQLRRSGQRHRRRPTLACLSAARTPTVTTCSTRSPSAPMRSFALAWTRTAVRCRWCTPSLTVPTWPTRAWPVASKQDIDYTAELNWLNDTGAPVDLIVAADSTLSSHDEPFGLVIEVRPQECTPGERRCLAGTNIHPAVQRRGPLRQRLLLEHLRAGARSERV